jgi:hypothetical protein
MTRQGVVERTRRFAATPVAVVLVATSAYAVWTVWYLSGRPAVGLAHVGTRFVERGAPNERIDDLRDDAVGDAGYDGQFFLYMALDPLGAREHLDDPAYRYTRILYPLAASALALGFAGAIPLTLLLVNLLAVAGGTWALAVLLRRRGVSPWFAAAFAVYPGLWVAVSHDLSEPLAYALVACALLVLDAERCRRPLAGAAVLALAGLTREVTLVFAVALAIGVVAARRTSRAGGPWQTAAASLGLAVLPYVLWKVGLGIWLSSAGTPEATRLSPWPFGGLLAHWPLNRLLVEQLYSVVLPSLVAALAALVHLRRDPFALAAICLNVLVLVVLLPDPSYDDYKASGRITTGVLVAFLASLPLLVQRRASPAWIWLPLVFWLAPWWDLLPTAFGR